MFDNIGGKIKTLAQVFCWIGIVSSALSGLVIMFDDDFLLGILIAAIGALLSWISSFTLYGFGQLIENSEIANGNTYEIYQLLKKSLPEKEKEDEKKTVSPTVPTSYNKSSTDCWYCKECDSRNEANARFCKSCGTFK